MYSLNALHAPQFGDFVEWYMGKRPSREVKEAAIKSSQ
jgi:hypothetical protein